MLRTHWQAFQTLTLMAEIAIGAAIFSLLVVATGSWYAADEAGRMALVVLGITGCAAWPVALHSLGLHTSQRRREIVWIVPRLVAAGFGCTVLVAAGAFTLKAPVSAHFPLWFGTAQFASLSLLRLTILGALRLARRAGRNYRNVVVVGTGPRAREVRRSLEEHPSWGLRVIGYVDDYECASDGREPLAPVYKFIDLPDLFREAVIDEVVIAYPRSMLHLLEPVVHICSITGVPMTLLSDIFGDYVPPPRVTRFGAIAALNFAPVHHVGFALGVKRAMDVVGAALGLAVSAPFLAVAAALVWATSPGPILFKQVRCGLHGRRFWMYKLRTMVSDAEERKGELLDLNESDGPVFKMRRDPRVTAVGRLLRRWSLDELPQLWNVLVGDMSLVGPRPPVPTEVALYETPQRRRLSMRPGLTCYWQIMGRSAIGFEDWVKLDIQYIETWSLTRDLEILLRTIPAVLSGRGAS